MKAAGDATTGSVSAFPWETVMMAGLHRLRLSPKDFWRMTPRELAAALGGRQQGSAIDRAAFEVLRRAFPDGEDFGDGD